MKPPGSGASDNKALKQNRRYCISHFFDLEVMMPYTHFRMIAYEVPTATFQGGGPVVSGWDPGQAYQAIGRLPVPNNTNNDAKIRLQRLAGVVEFAYNRLQTIGDNANTLKVFVVPEFYFRPPVLGANYLNNTYPQEAVNQVWTALDSMFVHHDFNNWLFICGTAMWNTLSDTMVTPVYFNTAIYVRGGQAQGLRLIEKQLASGIDGVPQAMAPSMTPDVSPIFAEWGVRKQHVFTIDNITFGLEVCLDHANNGDGPVLKKVLAAWQGRQGAAPPEVKIHVLTAGGMDIEVESVAAKVGGYIFRNDGMANPGARSELYQVQSYNTPDPLGAQLLIANQFDPTAAASANLGANIAPQQSDPLPAGPLTLPMPGVAYTTFPQQVSFYPALAVPN
jgi:hypothetical protein